MASGTIKKTKELLIQTGTISETLSPSQWNNIDITFPVPFSEKPLVSFYQTDGATSNMPIPVGQYVSKTGFRAAFYGNPVSVAHLTWQAIGYVN